MTILIALGALLISVVCRAFLSLSGDASSAGTEQNASDGPVHRSAIGFTRRKAN
jgi:hypothetical protein